MNRRYVLASVGTFLCGLAGCVETGTETGEPATSQTPTERPPDAGDDGKPPSTQTPTDQPPDAGGDGEPTDTSSNSSGLGEKTNSPNPDHPVRVINYDDTAHTVSVEITQNGTVVDTFSHEVSPDANVVAYNLRQVDPDGIEEYDVSATVGNQTESVTVRTNDCFGDINITVQSDGSLFVRFAIC
jgi:hypothetical protein